MDAKYDWQSIIALNITSTLSQVGQFGIPFVVMPVWLTLQGADTLHLSLFASSLWLGQLPGLGLAPYLSQRFGPKRVVLAALLATALALVLLGLGSAVLWVPAGLLAGWGQGLRWIGLEPWLYRIAPAHARGKFIGFHESLIALAPIIAPLLVAVWGLAGHVPVAVGLVFVGAAALPLVWAHENGATQPVDAEVAAPLNPLRWQLPKEPVFLLGVGIALVGGLSEAAFIGLFPLFGLARHLPADQLASLLTTFGLGGFLFQYAVGWLADHRGMFATCLWCCAGTVGVALVLMLDLNLQLLHAAVFCLGGLLTSYLTLALIASAKTVGGNMTSNMSVISILYTLSAVLGPLVGGALAYGVGGNGLMVALAVFPLALLAYIGMQARVSRA